jgi:serine/threonine protein kinase
MANLDAAVLGEKAVRLGLISLDQLNEAWDELGAPGGEAESLVRVLERKGHLTPWQSQKLLKDDPDGYFLGGYRILYKIASGSFGRVYRADDPRTGTIVAVKVLRRKWSDDPHSVDLFEREGKLGMSLRHPNVVEILAVNRDTATKQYFIVMEFVEGGNLREIMNIRKKLEPLEALKLLEDAAAGMAYAFSRGVSHRDMKLTNILISSTGTAKLVDFGLAGLFGKQQQQHEKDKGDVDRTVDYAGLEKASGAAPGDIRSDIFFLGCVAYEILTAHPPITMSRDPRARMSNERFKDIPPLKPEDVTGPPGLFRLVNTMLAVNPNQRYQTPAQLLEAVKEVRREMEGKASGKSGPVTRTVFIVEKDERLQDILREKLKEAGLRVLISGDPVRAVDRFRQQSLDALIIDAATVGEESIRIFERLLDDAERNNQYCGGVLMLAQEQANWQTKLKPRPNQAVMLHPVKLKQLLRALQELLRKHPG